MSRYVAQRLLQIVPVVFGATLFFFTLAYALPGDPVRALGGTRGMAESTVQALRERYNLDDGFWVQYGKYLGVVPDDDGFSGVLQADLGVDFNDEPVSSIVGRRLPTTLRLAAGALVVEVLLGVAAGVVSAVRRGGFLDNLVLVSTIAVVSIPLFVIAVLVQRFIGLRVGWLPALGTDAGWSAYVLPSLVLASVSVAYVARLTRASLADQLRTDYVRMATAKGLRPRRVVGVHALRNSLLPVVTFVGVDVGAFVGGAVIVETVFGLPGIGLALLDAVREREGAVVVGLATFFVLVYALVTLVVDLLYAVLDPRIRHG